MKDASSLDFKQNYPSFPEFARHGIPLNLVSAELILCLQQIRDKTGIPIYPSPLPSAWARTDGSQTSRHYAVNRLSDAGDVFPDRGRFLELYLHLQQVSDIGGIGIYADTNGPDGEPWPMIHFDLRPVNLRVFWARDGKYCSLAKDPAGYARVLAKIIEMEADNGYMG